MDKVNKTKKTLIFPKVSLSSCFIVIISFNKQYMIITEKGGKMREEHKNHP